LAKASEQFRQSDVTTWGIVALVLAALAVLSANVSALMPQSLLSGLHRTRIEGASVEQLRVQVAQLRSETQELRRENGVLTNRFNLGEQQNNEVTRRVGALEVSLPPLLESVASGVPVDLANVTASIQQPAGETAPAEGGSVMVRTQPLPGSDAAAPTQPLPAPVETAMAESAYGVALGPAVDGAAASEAWRDLDMKLGPLLLGMAPRLADQSESDEKRIVVGPIEQLADATTLCGRVERISVACMPVPFTGTPLNP
jgi:hypothetical protein